MPAAKKLIEVDLPLAAINAAAAREKSIRHGHPSTLHLWWARRPLAACRAVLFAQLVDDPSAHPAEFPTDADQAAERARLKAIIERIVPWEASTDEAALLAARREIARSVARPHGVRVAPDADAATVDAALRQYAPPVLDPFCGGGSIPLEAQRLGLQAHASDLNPVAVLITKALIEIPPRFADRPPVNPRARSESRGERTEDALPRTDRLAEGDGGSDLVSPSGDSPSEAAPGRGKSDAHHDASSPARRLTAHSSTLFPRPYFGAQGLAEDVRYYGRWMRDEAETRIGHLYPKVKLPPEHGGGEATVIAWLWARTVTCPNPACRAQLPLVRSFALATKQGKEAWVEPVIDHTQTPPSIRFETRTGPGAPSGTVNRRGARCIACGTAVSFDHVRSEGRAGRMDAQLMAIVAEGKGGRIYISPTNDTVPALSPGEQRVIQEAREAFLSGETPRRLTGGTCYGYGLTTWGSLFTPRQLVALTTFSDLVADARARALADALAAGLPDDGILLADGGAGATAYADAIATYLAFAVDKMTDPNTVLCTWQTDPPRLRSTFGRQALPMTWDFAETNVFGDAAGDYQRSVDSLIKVLETLGHGLPGGVCQLDGAAAVKPISRPVVSTDPPYYDNIGYADLSDFFYVWLRRALSQAFPALFSTLLVPKAQELVATPYRFDGDRDKARQFFETGLGKAFANIRASQNPHYPLAVYYAFKQAEDDDSDEGERVATASTGWETMLEGLIQAGFTVTGTWPMRTEMGTRNVGRGTNALASSIVLVCRPRPADAPIATRRDFLRALRAELPPALHKLTSGDVPPVDLAQAAIGPGMAVFSRYARVLEADGSPMRVRTALALINDAIQTYFAEHEGDLDPVSQFCLAWYKQHATEPGPFGDADVLSRAKDVAVDALARAALLKSHAGKVQLLPATDPAYHGDWEPRGARPISVWEATHRLVAAHTSGGDRAAARLAYRLGGLADQARDFAYRLFQIADAQDGPAATQAAIGYNDLVVAWPAIQRLAADTQADYQLPGQTRLDL